ncbi:MAG: undecaprenyl phosphate translocase family protein, partial [Planctomycetota bacterium]
MLEPARPIRPPSVSLTFTSGLLMGGADAVPGVSGGTIALLLGLYERLIEATATVLRFPVLLRSAVGRERLAVSVRFLLPLLAGILVAYYLVTLLLVGPAERPGLLRRAESAPFCFAFFSGLVLMSLREPWRRIGKAGPRHGVALVLAAAAAAMLTGLPHAQGDVPLWAFLYGGALAVGVMLLPGVSGSLLLVVLGQYTIVA